MTLQLGEGRGSRLGIRISRKFGTASSARAPGSMEPAMFWAQMWWNFYVETFQETLVPQGFLKFS
jgi:hypothetical protein